MNVEKTMVYKVKDLEIKDSGLDKSYAERDCIWHRIAVKRKSVPRDRLLPNTGLYLLFNFCTILFQFLF